MRTLLKKKVSLKDIARETGLSTPTISQILNDRQTNFSSDANKRLVRKTAKELGYTPNFGYKVMRGFSTKTVSLIISLQRVQEESYIQVLILRLMAAFDKKGYATYISIFSMNCEENIDRINVLIARGVENFVFLGSPVGHLEIRSLLQEKGKTYIGYDSYFQRDVIPDVAYGFETVLLHYVSSGRKNIRLLMPVESKRFQGLRNAFPALSEDELKSRYFEKVEIPDLADWTHTESCFNIGYETTKRMFDEGRTADALIYLSDIFAVGGVKYLLERNYSIGRDIAVAGHNYTDMVRYGSHPITSVEHDTAATAAVLLENFDGVEPFTALVKPIVHIKETLRGNTPRVRGWNGADGQ